MKYDEASSGSFYFSMTTNKCPSINNNYFKGKKNEILLEFLQINLDYNTNYKLIIILSND